MGGLLRTSLSIGLACALASVSLAFASETAPPPSTNPAGQSAQPALPASADAITPKSVLSLEIVVAGDLPEQAPLNEARKGCGTQTPRPGDVKPRAGTWVFQYSCEALS